MRTLFRILTPILGSVALLSGCAGNRLHEYDYQDRTLAVVSDVPYRPEVLSGSLFDLRPSGDPVRDIMRAGARVVREVEASALQARLDSASVRVDVGVAMEEDVLQRASRYMGAEPAPDSREAEYLMEIVVSDYGIQADAWDAPAEFYFEADAALLHGPSGTEIWRAGISARDPVGPAIWSGPQEIRDVLSAAVLATLSVDELVALMEGLADYSARIVTDRLRDDLRKARAR